MAAALVMASSGLAVPAQAFSSSTPPPGPPSVNAGGYMSCGVRADKTAACWGDNVGIAGNFREGPGQATPPAGMTFTEVNAGYSHACGVRQDTDNLANDKTVVCWGASASGCPMPGPWTATCGTGASTIGGSAPPPGMKFTHVAPGVVFTCGIREDTVNPANDKTAVCWGQSEFNQVRAVPAGVKFTQLAVGARHACGLRARPVNGNNIICWGYSLENIGNVPAGTFSSLNSGNFDNCALSPEGVPRCWGRNAAAQSTVPAGETFTQVSAGFQHVCGLRSDQTLRCWGSNSQGQATAPPGTYNNVSTGTFHSCAMSTAGEAVCWGGTGAAAGRGQPVMTSALPPSPVAQGASYSHQITTTYMSPPVTWAVTSGALPPGLALGPTGLLSGTPSQAGTYSNITVSASNGLATARQTFTITVT